MKRDFDIGDKVICRKSGVVGQVIKFYIPTASAEQTMVKTLRGLYHAPTNDWVKADQPYTAAEIVELERGEQLLNPYGEYVLKFASNHGISIHEAYEHPTVKARYHFFQESGM